MITTLTPYGLELVTTIGKTKSKKFVGSSYVFNPNSERVIYTKSTLGSMNYKEDIDLEKFHQLALSDFLKRAVGKDLNKSLC